MQKDIDFSKIGRKSRRKGKSFEYKIKQMICKYLQIPKEYLERPNEWTSQPLGDLIVLGQYYERLPIFIEAKKRENFQFKTLFNNPDDNVVLRWWFQTAIKIPNEEDRLRLMLVFSKNYYPILFMVSYSIFQELCNFHKNPLKVFTMLYSEKIDDLFIIGKFEDFLKVRAEIIGLTN